MRPNPSLEPRTLDIPLHSRQWLWLQVAAAVLAVGVVLLITLPEFGTVFLAASIVALPVLLAVIFPKSRGLGSGGLLKKVVVLAAVLLYLRLAKVVLVPGLIELLKSFQ